MPFLSRLLSSGSLVLLSPSDEDEGYFECTAVNEVGEERRVIEVILQGNGSEVCATCKMFFGIPECLTCMLLHSPTFY